jgi:hypothetical protein
MQVKYGKNDFSKNTGTASFIKDENLFKRNRQATKRIQGSRKAGVIIINTYRVT